ncbi:hypothetical protein Nepgr_033858 [Nepenthes gracilis]|uniref:Uncharacterized protein n=1 Tax=Nepenthes gracilis TaxID=150966 RepID=A0AAD3TMS5_NEPGR|nr:hypothetical protein Nepgr_033858 [Nepenthes gracilis]
MISIHFGVPSIIKLHAPGSTVQHCIPSADKHSSSNIQNSSTELLMQDQQSSRHQHPKGGYTWEQSPIKIGCKLAHQPGQKAAKCIRNNQYTQAQSNKTTGNIHSVHNSITGE